MTTLLKALNGIGNTALQNEENHYKTSLESIRKEHPVFPMKNMYLFGHNVSVDPIQEQELLLGKRKNIINGYQTVAKNIKEMFKNKGLSEPAVIPMELFRKICKTCDLAIMQPPKENRISKLVYYELLPILLYQHLAEKKKDLIRADIEKIDAKAANSFITNILCKFIQLHRLETNKWCYEDRNQGILSDVQKKIRRIVQKHIQDAFEELDISDIAFLLCREISAFHGKDIFECGNKFFHVLGISNTDEQRSGYLKTFTDGKWMQYEIEFEPLSQKEQHLLLDLFREFPENDVHIAFDKRAVKDIRLERKYENIFKKYGSIIENLSAQLILELEEIYRKELTITNSISLHEMVNSIKNDFYEHWKQQPGLNSSIDEHIANHHKRFEERRKYYLENLTNCNDNEVKDVVAKNYLTRDELRAMLGEEKYNQLIDPIFFMPWKETYENRNYDLAIVYLHSGTLPNEEKAMELIHNADHSVFLGVQSN